MAKSIRELRPVNAEGAYLNGETLFECVTDMPDSEGILARKASGLQLEEYIARAGDDPKGLTEALIDEKVLAETERAEAEEAALAGMIEEAENAASGGTETERLRAEAAEGYLDMIKADKIIAKKTLNNAEIGEQLGEVRFKTWETPPAPAAEGFIELDDGKRFSLSAAGEFVYWDGAADIEIYAGGEWKRNSVNTGIAAVALTQNADGGAWGYARYGSRDENLEDVKNLAAEAKRNAGNALNSAAEANLKNTEQDARLAALETRVRDYVFADAAAAQSAIAGAPEIEAAGNLIALEDGGTLHLYAGGGWIPALAQEDGRMIRVADFAAKFGSEDRGKLLTKVEKAAMDAALGAHTEDEEAHVSGEDRARWDGAGEGTVKSVSVNGGDPLEPDGDGNVDLGGIASQAMLVSAVSAEQAARQSGDAGVLDDAKDYTDLALADHALNTQYWLPSAAEHEDLPDPAGIADRTKTYLCRVYGENNVYQLRPPDPPAPDVWDLYSQNDAYVQRTSTETAGDVTRNYALLNNGGELAGSAETRDAGGTDQFTVFRQTGEAVTLEYLDSAGGAGKKVDYRGGILRYGGDTAAHEAAVKGDLAGLMDIDGAEWTDG